MFSEISNKRFLDFARNDKNKIVEVAEKHESEIVYITAAQQL